MIRKFVVEEKIIGRETTVGILGGQVLPVVEVRPKAGSYDYKNKYTAGATEYFCPADFDAATTKRIQDAALGAFTAIGGRDYARVDVMVRIRWTGSPVVSGSEHAAGHDRDEFVAESGGGGGHELCRAVPADG